MVATFVSWFVRGFRCGSDEVKASNCPSTKGTSRGGESSPTSSLSTVVNPVVYIDREGFEWAIDDGPPTRPNSIPTSALFIPFEIRPKRGYLKNQVLTDCEVPDLRSPLGLSAPRISIHTEQLLRRLRMRSMELSDSTGAHLRSRSGKHLIRRDLAVKRERASSINESVSTTGSSDKLKPPSQRVAASLDSNTYLAMRARMAAHRR